MRKKRSGVVVSDKMDKSIIVKVDTRFKHKLYGKIIAKTKRYVVHDPNNIAVIGDKVLLEEHAPISAKKHWILKSVII